MTEASLSATVRDLAAEVEIPVEGTLSRVVFRDEHIRVVVFAFDEGQELTEHTASVPAILEIVSGRLDLELGKERVEVSPGSWVHMPARLPHSVRALEPSVMLLTMLRER